MLQWLTSEDEYVSRLLKVPTLDNEENDFFMLLLLDFVIIVQLSTGTHIIYYYTLFPLFSPHFSCDMFTFLNIF